MYDSEQFKQLYFKENILYADLIEPLYKLDLVPQIYFKKIYSNFKRNII